MVHGAQRHEREHPRTFARLKKRGGVSGLPRHTTTPQAEEEYSCVTTLFRYYSVGKEACGDNEEYFSLLSNQNNPFSGHTSRRGGMLFPFPILCRVALPFSNDSRIFALFGILKPILCRDMSPYYF
jgi:hypothetical protein